MAFIDKLGEKISSGANAVSLSTKRVTESARINSEISANTAEIDKLMRQLGICVKSRLMDQISDPEAEQIAAQIDALIAEKERLAEELQTVKGIRRCENCGTELPQNSVYCPSCGARSAPVVQPVKAKASVSAVPENGAANEDKTKAVFCTVCGYRETGNAVYCPNCGNKLNN